MDKSITGNHSEINHAGAIAEQSALRNKNIELQEGYVLLYQLFDFFVKK